MLKEKKYNAEDLEFAKDTYNVADLIIHFNCLGK